MHDFKPHQRLDPEHLDAEALDADSYHATVGPALQAAAGAAATRGHPMLHDDMPAMLALVDMVSQLAGLYAETYPRRASDPVSLDNAAAGACVMVLQQADMPAQTIGQCLAALETAYHQLHEHAVLDAARPYIAMAFSHLVDEQREAARRCLEQATRHSIAAIETWQAQVH